MATPRSTRASAPGKAVLLGEYVVLEGAPALVAAIDRRARVSISDASAYALTSAALGLDAAAFACADDGTLRFAARDHEAMPQLQTVRAVFAVAQRALQQHGMHLRPCRIAICTAAFCAADGTKLGLGSSAAVSVALLAALLTHHGAPADVLPPDPEGHRAALMQMAADVHASAQGGMGSGIDIAASVHGGVLRFQRRGGQAHVTPAGALPALGTAFTWAGHATSTPEFLDRVRAFKARDGAGHAHVMTRLGMAARAGADAWGRGCIPDFLAAVATSFAGLAELGRHSGADIASASHRAMDAVVASAGGVYKSSGAGGGDLGVAFASSPPLAQDVARALAAADFSVLPLAIDPRGVQIEACTSTRGPSA